MEQDKIQDEIDNRLDKIQKDFDSNKQSLLESQFIHNFKELSIRIYNQAMDDVDKEDMRKVIEKFNELEISYAGSILAMMNDSIVENLRIAECLIALLNVKRVEKEDKVIQ